MKINKIPLITALVISLLSMATLAGAQVTHVQYYDSLRIITHNRAEAKYIEFIERAHDKAKEGTITLYRFGPDTADYVLLEKGSYDTVFQPRKVHGQLLKWYPNGKRQSIKNYTHGIADGIDAAWYENDSLLHEMYFKMGQHDGSLRTYYDNGVLRRDEVYQDGKRVSGRVYNKNREEIAFVPYREAPTFPGGEQELLKYLKRHIRYPAASARQRVSGVVVLRFTVDKAGDIKYLHVLQGVNDELDAEAVRVVQKMPKWVPGKLEGELAAVQYYLPVKFTAR